MGLKVVAVAYTIKTIATRRIPAKVSERVIVTVPVVVAAKITFWPRPDEGFEHQHMNAFGVILAVAREPNCPPAVLVRAAEALLQ